MGWFKFVTISLFFILVLDYCNSYDQDDMEIEAMKWTHPGCTSCHGGPKDYQQEELKNRPWDSQMYGEILEKAIQDKLDSLHNNEDSSNYQQPVEEYFNWD